MKQKNKTAGEKKRTTNKIGSRKNCWLYARFVGLGIAKRHFTAR